MRKFSILPNALSVLNLNALPLLERPVVSSGSGVISYGIWKDRVEELVQEMLFVEISKDVHFTKECRMLVTHDYAISNTPELNKMKSKTLAKLEADSSLLFGIPPNATIDNVFNHFVWSKLEKLHDYSHRIIVAAAVSTSLAHVGLVSTNPALACALYSTIGLSFAEDTVIDGINYGSSGVFKGIVSRYMEDLCLALDKLVPHKQNESFLGSANLKDEAFRKFTVYFQHDPSRATIGLLNDLKSVYKLQVIVETKSADALQRLKQHKGPAVFIRNLFDKHPYADVDMWKEQFKQFSSTCNWQSHPSVLLPMQFDEVGMASVPQVVQIIGKSDTDNAAKLQNLRDLIYFSKVINYHFENNLLTTYKE